MQRHMAPTVGALQAALQPCPNLFCPVLPSPSGGVTRVDEAKTAECYGAGASVRDILWGKVEPPHQLAPLYERLAKIASSWIAEEEDEKL